MWWLRNRKHIDSQPDREKDAETVAAAAAALSISEFRLFHLAYQDWYGEKPRLELLEEAFQHYLTKTLVPLWVRNFSRKILTLFAEKRLNPVDFGIQPVPGVGFKSILFGAVALVQVLV